MSTEVADILSRLSKADVNAITEIRLRADKPILLHLNKQEYTIRDDGSLTAVPTRGSFTLTATDIAKTIERISQYSFYAFEAELSHGYITLPGGHRVGVCGHAVVENGTVRAWQHISSINFRVAHAIKGCADPVLPFLYTDGSIRHTMIISPPGAGKTTLLRDIVRQISDRGLTVGLVDERSEVAGSFRGIPQNDVGLRTDVLDACPKAEGMVMLLRAMAPHVIAVDELGGKKDADAVEAVLTAGVKLLSTVHGNSLEDVQQNPNLAGLVARGIFERYIVLSAPGTTPEIFDGKGGWLCSQQ